MTAFCRCLALTALATTMANAQQAGDWKPADSPLKTRWADKVRPDNVWPEYPRPHLVREDWQSLNGLWDYGITPFGDRDAPEQFDGKILVPFCVESALSGVKKPVQPDQALWYRREFRVPDAWASRRVLLHFGAVDWSTRVWVNGQLVGEHQGGYDPFHFDITEALVGRGPLGGQDPQELVVRVTDPTDSHWQPRGKQVLKPQGIWYTAVTGIWQTVWLEPVPLIHIRGLKIIPDVDRSAVHIETNVSSFGSVDLVVEDADHRVIRQRNAEPGTRVTIKIPNPKLWSPDSPYLYKLTARLHDSLGSRDTVQSYFGLRKIGLGKHNGHTRILLNNEPLFQLGPLDQGWWPDGLYTAPSDAALRYDIEVLKQLRMNMLRKHVKIEPARLYYHCDRLGLLVWQDMPSGDRYIGGSDPDIQRDAESGANFERELRAMIDSLHNHPSIVMWVIYNEGWGQWDTERLTKWVKEYDPTRLVNAASGWTDRGVGDVIDVHAYPGPGMRPPEEHRASVLGEFGGLGWPVKGRLWQDRRNWGYRTYASRDELQTHYADVVRRVWPLIGQGLSAAVYTQTSDVESEVNGLMTYDRAVLKLDVGPAAALHTHLYRPAPRIETIVESSDTAPQTWRYVLDAPPTGWILPGFDDSRWSTGPGMFGREGTPGVRVGTAWTTSDIWMRRPFPLTALPAGELYLRMYHDEDAEVYINGVLAGRFKGWVTGPVLAKANDAARNALHVGTNVLAVHCHQTDGGQGIDVGICVLKSPVAR
jgi:hypothetical protein